MPDGFLAIRHAATQGGVLAFFPKTVTITTPPNYREEDAITPTVTITSLPPEAPTRGAFENDSTINEDERISVFFSPDPDYAGGRPGKPVMAEALVITGDEDQRPYTYRGETRNVGDTNQEFVYQRPKRVVTNRR